MRNLPTITRNILLINILVFLLDWSLERHGIQLSGLLGLHYIDSTNFRFWQPVTYMFMHANFGHIFCNMFAVWMFGPVLEQEWGARKYLTFFLICGLGAALVQELVWSWRIHALLQTYSAESVFSNYAQQVVTIGASGAVFGILFAFGWLFPNVPMFILFIPIPIRARIIVIVYALIELGAGLANISGDNIAHFAHLGGMLFGWLLLLWWRRGDGHNDSNEHKGQNLDSSKDNRFSGYHYQRRMDDNENQQE